MNGIEMTRRCLESVIRYSPKDQFELILTDNASNDGTAPYFDALAKEHPHIKVVHNAKNEGFIEPNKKALAMAAGKYLVLLNNDCVVCPWWLLRLDQPFQKFPKAAISGVTQFPHSLNMDMCGFAGPRFEYVEFSCAMLSVPIMREHGLFSDYLTGAYAEDGDTCLRMRELGYTLHWSVLPVQHLKNGTSRNVPETRQWQINNSAAASRRWRHYLKMKDRRMDYPLVIHRVKNEADFERHLPTVQRILKEKPISNLYVETDVPHLFTGLNVTAVDQTRQLDELRMSLDVPENPKVVVVYVYPIFGGIHDQMAERFISSYIQFPAASPHELYVVSNGGPPTPKMQDTINRVRHKVLIHDDSGWDIGAYQKAAREIPCDLMVFMGGNSYLRGIGWLERMVEAYCKHGAAIYGATGNQGDARVRVSPHVRTTGFWCDPKLLNDYPHPTNNDRGSRYQFEHGPNSFTVWAEAKGLKSWIVTWNGEYLRPYWDTIPNGFHRGDQSAIMVGDRLTGPEYSTTKQ